MSGRAEQRQRLITMVECTFSHLNATLNILLIFALLCRLLKKRWPFQQIGSWQRALNIALPVTLTASLDDHETKLI